MKRIINKLLLASTLYPNFIRQGVHNRGAWKDPRRIRLCYVSVLSIVVGPAFLPLLVPFLALGNFPVQQASCAGSRNFFRKALFRTQCFQIVHLDSGLIFPIMHWCGLTGYSVFWMSPLFHVKQFLFYRNWLKATCIASTHHILHFPYHVSLQYTW